jgi:hypothetical protein
LNIDNLNEESTEGVPSGKSFDLFQKAAVASLALSSAVSFIVGLFLVDRGSEFYYLLIASGLLRAVIAVFCWRGSARAFRAATISAIVTSIVDLSSGGVISFGGTLYLFPQILVIVFSHLASRKMQEAASIPQLNRRRYE